MTFRLWRCFLLWALFESFFSTLSIRYDIWQIFYASKISKNIKIYPTKRIDCNIFSFKIVHFASQNMNFICISFLELDQYPSFHPFMLTLYFRYWNFLKTEIINLKLPKKYLNGEAFYPRENYFTLALLVMLVTNLSTLKYIKT